MGHLISGLLAEKGDAPYKIYAEAALEVAGCYRNHDYVVLFQKMGFRCGYVSVPRTDLLYGKKQKLENLDVHGGVTYCQEPEENYLLNYRLRDGSGDMWIGFDAGHAWDGVDIVTASKIFVNDKEVLALVDRPHWRDNGYPVRDAGYIIMHCKQLIDQLCGDKNDK